MSWFKVTTASGAFKPELTATKEMLRAVAAGSRCAMTIRSRVDPVAERNRKPDRPACAWGLARIPRQGTGQKEPRRSGAKVSVVSRQAIRLSGRGQGGHLNEKRGPSSGDLGPGAALRSSRGDPARMVDTGIAPPASPASPVISSNSSSESYSALSAALLALTAALYCSDGNGPGRPPILAGG
jgi:hypothetical protein